MLGVLDAWGLTMWRYGWTYLVQCDGPHVDGWEKVRLISCAERLQLEKWGFLLGGFSTWVDMAMATQLGFALHTPSAKLGSFQGSRATQRCVVERIGGRVNPRGARRSVAVRAATGNNNNTTIRAAKKGSPPMMPAVLTPSGPVDLNTLMLRNRIIFVGSPVNSEVCASSFSSWFWLRTSIEIAAEIWRGILCGRWHSQWFPSFWL